jgi:hypothetical protein
VITGGFGVLTTSITELSAYLATHGTDARALIGRAGDQVKTFGELPARGEVWREFVPAATLGR